MAKLLHDLGGPLRYAVEQRNGQSVVTLDGYINEATDFAPVLAMPSPLRLDLSKVDRINSLGVRTWIGFLQKYEATGGEVAVERCPPIMVQQHSMISNFMGARSRIESALVPFICPSCSTEHLQLVDVKPGGGDALSAGVSCPKCKTAMELDDLPETYERLFSAP